MDKYNNHSVCFSGHRPDKLFKDSINKEEQLQKLSDCLYGLILDCINENFTDFYSGMARGVDLIASELVLEFKQNNDKIKHHAVYPFANQCNSKYNTYWKNKFMKVLINSDTNTVLNQRYTRGCYQQRNKYLVDNSSRLIAVFNGDYNSGTGKTIQYALKMNIEVIIVHTSDNNLPIEIISPK